jgi:hypothetical protein
MCCIFFSGTRRMRLQFLAHASLLLVCSSKHNLWFRYQFLGSGMCGGSLQLCSPIYAGRLRVMHLRDGCHWLLEEVRSVHCIRLIRRISKSMMLLYRLVGAEHDLLFNQKGAKAAHDLHLQYIPADLYYDLLARQSGPDY